MTKNRRPIIIISKEVLGKTEPGSRMIKIIEKFLMRRIHHGFGMVASGVVMAMFPFSSPQEELVFGIFSGILMATGGVFLLAAAVLRLSKRLKNG
ncbi:hypothetical protein [Roseibium sp. RKSG952]|uniref:hypothetical protein n=1 Tax=Roseibium sp. RKSG952 TaxID=2529384 RepID=UPI0012BBCEFA|nr:hypothetical protein [Roseibium sp. RKSG952]MTH94932.1 hypothetical protein [Roseibium sp. RKSG952]